MRPDPLMSRTLPPFSLPSLNSFSLSLTVQSTNNQAAAVPPFPTSKQPTTPHKQPATALHATSQQQPGFLPPSSSHGCLFVPQQQQAAVTPSIAPPRSFPPPFCAPLHHNYHLYLHPFLVPPL